MYWDFDKALDEKGKAQIEILLNEIVRTIKNREDRRNRYLLPLKCLFCYAEKNGLKDIQKMERDQEQEYYVMLKHEYEGICPNPKRFNIFCRKVLFLESVTKKVFLHAGFTRNFIYFLMGCSLMTAPFLRSGNKSARLEKSN